MNDITTSFCLTVGHEILNNTVYFLKVTIFTLDIEIFNYKKMYEKVGIRSNELILFNQPHHEHVNVISLPNKTMVMSITA